MKSALTGIGSKGRTEKLISDILRVNRKVLGSKTNYLMIFCIDNLLLVFADEHPNSGIDQKGPENIHNPAKLID